MDNTPGTSSATSPMFAMSGDGTDDVIIPVVFLFHQDASDLMDAMYNNPALEVTVTDLRAMQQQQQQQQHETGSS
jgi:mannosidase alpha-like ER degradation enhancer 3